MQNICGEITETSDLVSVILLKRASSLSIFEGGGVSEFIVQYLFPKETSSAE